MGPFGDPGRLGNKEGGQGLKGEGQRSGIQGNWEYLSQKGFFLFLATKLKTFLFAIFKSLTKKNTGQDVKRSVLDCES